MAAVGAALWAGLTACRPGDTAPIARPWHIAVLELDGGVDAQDAVQGVGDGLRDSGLREGKDYTLTVHSAQGDATALPELARNAVHGGANALVTVGTPALAAALAAAPQTPVIFTGVADPGLAGVRGRSVWQRWVPWLVRDDRPPVTGVYAANSFAELLRTGSGVVDDDAGLGAVVASSDRDAVGYRDALRDAAASTAHQVHFEPMAGPGEMGVAAARLCREGVKVFVALGDPVSDAAFDVLVQAASTCGVPVFGSHEEQAAAGAVLTVARDIRGAGRQAGLVAARVANGEDPRRIDFIEVARPRVIVNAAAAERADVGIPLSLLQGADDVIGD